eukprot:scaffold115964_cov18-Tisochrysis_lutea.AAC.3
MSGVKKVVDDVLNGYNGTVMAYGQTGEDDRNVAEQVPVHLVFLSLLDVHTHACILMCPCTRKLQHECVHVAPQ